MLGLPFHVHEPTVRQLPEDQFEGGKGDMSQAGKVFVANNSARFGFGMGEPPQAQGRPLVPLWRGRRGYGR